MFEASLSPVKSAVPRQYRILRVGVVLFFLNLIGSEFFLPELGFHNNLS